MTLWVCLREVILTRLIEVRRPTPCRWHHSRGWDSGPSRKEMKCDWLSQAPSAVISPWRLTETATVNQRTFSLKCFVRVCQGMSAQQQKRKLSRLARDLQMWAVHYFMVKLYGKTSGAMPLYYLSWKHKHSSVPMLLKSSFNMGSCRLNTNYRQKSSPPYMSGMTKI